MHQLKSPLNCFIVLRQRRPDLNNSTEIKSFRDESSFLKLINQFYKIMKLIIVVRQELR